MRARITYYTTTQRGSTSPRPLASRFNNALHCIHGVGLHGLSSAAAISRISADLVHWPARAWAGDARRIRLPRGDSGASPVRPRVAAGSPLGSLQDGSDHTDTLLRRVRPCAAVHPIITYIIQYCIHTVTMASLVSTDGPRTGRPLCPGGMAPYLDANELAICVPAAVLVLVLAPPRACTMAVGRNRPGAIRYRIQPIAAFPASHGLLLDVRAPLPLQGYSRRFRDDAGERCCGGTRVPVECLPPSPPRRRCRCNTG